MRLPESLPTATPNWPTRTGQRTAMNNTTTTNTAGRPSMPQSGSAVKARQLVRPQLSLSLVPLAGPGLPTGSQRADPPPLTAGAALGEPGRHGEPAAHDERAGRVHAGAGELARRTVSWGPLLPSQRGMYRTQDLVTDWTWRGPGSWPPARSSARSRLGNRRHRAARRSEVVTTAA